MADRVCTRFIDDNGFDVGCKLVSKEYVLEAYPELVPWIKAPALLNWGINVSGYQGNNFGALGDCTSIGKSSPIQTLRAGSDWKQVSASASYYRPQTAAIKTDGTLWTWGIGDFGANAIGGLSTAFNIQCPVQSPLGTDWKQLSVGYSFSSAIKTDGTLWSWGVNSGTLGDNTIINRSSPVQTISGGTNWKQVSAGTSSGGAIKTDGTLWMWGSAGCGKLGDNAIGFRSSPVQTVSAGTNWKQISVGWDNIAAVKTDGTLWIWGSNFSGQLGTNLAGLAASRSSPVQTVSNATTWKQVSAGGAAAAAIKIDGTLWMWGFNGYGNLGANNVIARSSPVQTVSGGTNWKDVSAGRLTSGAIKTDGSLWMWGDNVNGQLGDNTSVLRRSSPVQTISGGTGWRQISVGYRHVAAICDVEE